MDKQATINATAEYVKKTISGDGSHDWWHVYRVWKNALHIAEKENVDLFTVELAALLHDITDFKFNEGDDTIGPKVAREWLESQKVDENIITHVCEIIASVTFKGAGTASSAKTKEAMVVQDADRLDALGAIGIARAFAYGGFKNREMYNPEIKPEKHDTFEQYKTSQGHTINHFYEKLLLLKDLMNTETAKQIAQERHVYMEQFLDRFYNEWEGKQYIWDKEIETLKKIEY